jgi:hypothetical protein
LKKHKDIYMKLNGDETFYVVMTEKSRYAEGGSGSYGGVKLYTLAGARTASRANNKRNIHPDDGPFLIYPVKLAMEPPLPGHEAGLK